jgi:hypothetical protein
MIHVHINKRSPTHVASINRQHPGADGHRSQEPWLLLRVDGRVQRFGSLSEAKDEALKLWAPCRFVRG